MGSCMETSLIATRWSPESARPADGAIVQLALTVLNPWQWFCSTRTLSNCLETTMTVLALSYWPWEWSIDDSELEDEEQWPHGWVDHTDREDLLSESV